MHSEVAAVETTDQSDVPSNNSDLAYNALGVPDDGTTTDPYSASVISDNVVQTLASDYAYMQQNGYTTDQQMQVAQQLGHDVKATVSYKTYTAGDIPTSADTSYAAMMRYRTDLQTSLKAMMQNKETELDYLGKYEQTQDPQYLTALRQAADNYKLAAAATAAITVPSDAASVQVGILNAMGEFGATLQTMAQSAQDPLAEAALVNTYFGAQQDMFSSFNNLYAYFKSKQPS